MIADNTGTILVVTGAITAGAIIAVLAPRLTLKLLFGGEDADARTVLVTRHWGVLVTIVSAMLVYAAYRPDVRTPIVVAAVVEKFAIGGLIFFSPFRTKPGALIVAIADTVIAVVFVVLLSRPGL